jgi:hypothetical protein
MSGKAAEATPLPGFPVFALLWVAYVGVLLVVYAPALTGPFVSDDLHYVAANPFVHGLTFENVKAILAPYGPATVAVVNYSPVQLLLHASVWEVFGAEVHAHHVLNLLFHALGSLLLVPLLVRSRIPLPMAAFASVFFLLHPANVEAVAWISQLKTNASFALAMGAVLCHERRPGWGALLFALALGAKPNAAVALPLVFWLEFVRSGRVRVPWLAIWVVLFAAFAVVEFTAHQRAGAAQATLYDTPLVLVRTVAGLAVRYVLLGYTSFWTSAFHEPDPATSWDDPWFLASIPVLGLLGLRFVSTLRGRKEEAGYWAVALVSFGPVSQLFPFLYPFADRYLYFILPGLLGGTLLAVGELFARVPEEQRSPWVRSAAAFALLLCIGFAFQSYERARIWRAPALILADAARNYPNGVSARLARAKSAARLGDTATAVAELRGAVDRGYNRFEQLMTDPAFDPIRREPAFRGLLREIAFSWIEAGAGWTDPTQGELRKLASAHAVRGEREEAVALLRRALALEGPHADAIRGDLRKLGAAP